MIKRCAEHLDDPEVAQLMDALNAKLGWEIVEGGCSLGLRPSKMVNKVTETYGDSMEIYEI